MDQNGFRVFARVFWLLRVTALIKFTQTLERDTKDKILIPSAYHLNGIFGNSGVNSNGTVHPGRKFSEKR